MRRALGLTAALGVALALLVGWLVSAGASQASPTTTPAGPPASAAAPPPARATLAPDGPPLVAGTPEEVREVVGFTRAAGVDQRATLRRMALESPDPLVVGNALRALGRLGAWAQDDELLALLADPRARVRQEAVLALGLSRDANAVRHLAPLLDEDDATLRTLAIQALGRVGGERARELLESLRADPGASPVERAFLRDALAAAGPAGRREASADDARR